jgi:hypothetical protein
VETLDSVGPELLQQLPLNFMRNNEVATATPGTVVPTPQELTVEEGRLSEDFRRETQAAALGAFNLGASVIDGSAVLEAAQTLNDVSDGHLKQTQKRLNANSSLLREDTETSQGASIERSLSSLSKDYQASLSDDAVQPKPSSTEEKFPRLPCLHQPTRRTRLKTTNSRQSAENLASRKTSLQWKCLRASHFRTKTDMEAR